MSIEDLVRARRVERVPADLEDPSAGELDRMRRFRNRIEYGTTSFQTLQVEDDLRHAHAIVDEVGRVLDP